MTAFRPLSLFFIVFWFTSCDCLTEGSGIVLDADSGLPLDSVSARSYIKKIDDDWFESEMFSDSTGLFYGATGITGASGGKCPDLIITLSRSGYYSDTIVNPNGDTVRLKKQ